MFLFTAVHCGTTTFTWVQDVSLALLLKASFDNNFSKTGLIKMSLPKNISSFVCFVFNFPQIWLTCGVPATISLIWSGPHVLMKTHPKHLQGANVGLWKMEQVQRILGWGHGLKWNKFEAKWNGRCQEPVSSWTRWTKPTHIVLLCHSNLRWKSGISLCFLSLDHLLSYLKFLYMAGDSCKSTYGVN